MPPRVGHCQRGPPAIGGEGFVAAGGGVVCGVGVGAVATGGAVVALEGVVAGGVGVVVDGGAVATTGVVVGGGVAVAGGRATTGVGTVDAITGGFGVGVVATGDAVVDVGGVVTTGVDGTVSNGDGFEAVDGSGGSVVGTPGGVAGGFVATGIGVVAGGFVAGGFVAISVEVVVEPAGALSRKDCPTCRVYGGARPFHSATCATVRP
jgi:hypothetical protein